jgi:hypothetical protein
VGWGGGKIRFFQSGDKTSRDRNLSRSGEDGGVWN